MDGQQAKTTRKRAVRLTDQALELLKSNLHQALSSGPSKPTRQDRAKALDLSVGTTDKLLAGKGVDRGSMTVAFERLGLEWNDDYCEYVTAHPTEVPIGIEETAPLKELSPSKSNPETAPARPLRRTPYWQPAAAFALMACLASVLAARPRDKQATQGENVSNPMNALLERATREYHACAYKAARSDVNLLLNQARVKEQANIVASGDILLGDLDTEQGADQEAKHCYREGISIRNALRETKCIAPLLEALGTVEERDGELAMSETHLKQSLAIFQNENDSTGVAMAARDLGSVELKAGHFAKAECWFESGLARVSKTKPDIVADIEGRRGLLLRDEGKYGEADSVLTNCLSYWQRQNHTRWIAVSLFRLGTVDVLAHKKQEALDRLLESKERYEKVGDKPGVTQCQQWLAKLQAFDSSAT